MLNSLFDGSDQVFSYPHELMIFNPKWKIKKLSKNFFDLYHDNIHNLSLKFNYQNFTNVEWNEKYKFIFSVFRHYDLFKKEQSYQYFLLLKRYMIHYCRSIPIHICIQFQLRKKYFD